MRAWTAHRSTWLCIGSAAILPPWRPPRSRRGTRPRRAIPSRRRRPVSTFWHRWASEPSRFTGMARPRRSPDRRVTSQASHPWPQFGPLPWPTDRESRSVRRRLVSRRRRIASGRGQRAFGSSHDRGGTPVGPSRVPYGRPRRDLSDPPVSCMVNGEVPTALTAHGGPK